jgi:hypothetical protein
VDFAESSNRALDYALSLAQCLWASIVVLHVVDRIYAEGLLDTPCEAQRQNGSASPGTGKTRSPGGGKIEPRRADQARRPPWWHTLDGLRRLDEVGYQTWRTLHHLSADASEADEGNVIERDQGEFVNH